MLGTFADLFAHALIMLQYYTNDYSNVFYLSFAI